MKSEELEGECDESSLEYYRYIRAITESNELSYWIGNPSVEIINGSIDLEPMLAFQIKHQPETYYQYLEQLQTANITSHYDTLLIHQKHHTHQHYHPQDSSCLVLCGIPNSKTPIEVIQNHSIDPFRKLIIQIRVIKTVHLKYYAMLLLFSSSKTANIFFNQLFGKQYHQVEMERIILRKMKSLSICFSGLNKDGLNHQINVFRKLNSKAEMQKVTAEQIFMTTHHLKLKLKQSNAMKQVESQGQLFCSICLSEPSNTIISILCGHYFDCDCLEKWESNTCPLCRYHQQPPIIKFCELCNQCEGLWVCLICGTRLCCGSNNNILDVDSHIYLHFQETSHSLSMELETKFLFDARIPAFLHQMFYKELIRKGAIQYSEPKIQANSDSPKHQDKKNKISDKISEYESQVAEEMKVQGSYFENTLFKQSKHQKEIINQKRQKIAELQAFLEDQEKQIISLETSNQQNESSIEQLEKQQKIISGLKKIYGEKAHKSNEKWDRVNEMERKRLVELEKEINLKKQDLMSLKDSLQLSVKLKAKLKNETVEGSIIFTNPEGKKSKGRKK